MGLLPDQPPDAAQEVACLADPVRVELLPLSTELGLALKVTVGAGVFADTVADCVALPPALVQVNIYVASAVSAPVDWEPLIGFAPDHEPEAVHAVALVVDQLSVALSPMVTLLGPTLKLTVGVGVFMETVAD